VSSNIFIGCSATLAPRTEVNHSLFSSLTYNAVGRKGDWHASEQYFKNVAGRRAGKRITFGGDARSTNRRAVQFNRSSCIASSWHFLSWTGSLQYPKGGLPQWSIIGVVSVGGSLDR
jgi:hypothetical protein